MEENFRGRFSMVKTWNFQKSFFHSIPEFLEYKKAEIQKFSEISNIYFTLESLNQWLEIFKKWSKLVQTESQIMFLSSKRSKMTLNVYTQLL